MVKNLNESDKFNTEQSFFNFSSWKTFRKKVDLSYRQNTSLYQSQILKEERNWKTSLLIQKVPKPNASQDSSTSDKATWLFQLLLATKCSIHVCEQLNQYASIYSFQLYSSHFSGLDEHAQPFFYESNQGFLLKPQQRTSPYMPEHTLQHG